MAYAIVFDEGTHSTVRGSFSLGRVDVKKNNDFSSSHNKNTSMWQKERLLEVRPLSELSVHSRGIF
jgi:hypothetical protein